MSGGPVATIGGNVATMPATAAMLQQRSPTKRPSTMHTSVGTTAGAAGPAMQQRGAVNDAKDHYRLLKKRFKFLVYENECYQEEIRNLQRKLLKLSRDKNFLLDRLLQYEKLSDSSDDSDASVQKVEEKKPKKKSRPSASRNRNRNQSAAMNNNATVANSSGGAAALSSSNTPSNKPTTATADVLDEQKMSPTPAEEEEEVEAKRMKLEDDAQHSPALEDRTFSR